MFRGTNWCLMLQIGFGVGYRLDIGVGVVVDVGKWCFSVLVLVF